MLRDCSRRLDSNKLQYLPSNCLNKIPKLMKIKLDKNPWHCDCHSVYLARFLREHFAKLWNGIAGGPICLGPGKMRFSCYFDGEWCFPFSFRWTGRQTGEIDLFLSQQTLKIWIFLVAGQRVAVWSSLLRSMALDGELVAEAAHQTADFRRDGNDRSVAGQHRRAEKQHQTVWQTKSFGDRETRFWNNRWRLFALTICILCNFTMNWKARYLFNDFVRLHVVRIYIWKIVQ